MSGGERERRRPTRRTPQVVDRSERKPAEVSDIVSNGIANFKVSAATPKVAYCHLARLFLAGFDNNGYELEPVNRVHSVELTGLGSAIATVIYVADNLVKGGVATYARIETEYLDGENEGASRQPGPRIAIRLTKNGKWNYKTDEELQKSKAYRRNVLNENVD
jgi:hypothetical protein